MTYGSDQSAGEALTPLPPAFEPPRRCHPNGPFHPSIPSIRRLQTHSHSFHWVRWMRKDVAQWGICGMNGWNFGTAQCASVEIVNWKTTERGGRKEDNQIFWGGHKNLTIEVGSREMQGKSFLMD